MTRRAYIKIIIGVGFLAFLLAWFYRKTGFYRKVDLDTLADKRDLIVELTETIIPETDTPGAARAGVADFILGYIRECASATDQRNFERGLVELASYSEQEYGRPFSDNSMDDRIAVLQHFEDRAVSRFGIVNKVYNKLFGKPFVVLLKELTVEGYCTSELGATQGLAYDYIPVRFEPCTVLGVDQRSWATK